MRSQFSTHGAMRGGGTIRSIASDVEVATCGDAGPAIAFVAASRGALAAMAALLRICDGVRIHDVLGRDETDASTRGRLAGVAPWPAPRRRRATLVWAFWEGPWLPRSIIDREDPAVGAVQLFRLVHREFAKRNGAATGCWARRVVR